MARGRIEIDVDRCKGCELCLPVCPHGVIALANALNRKGYHPAQLVDPEGRCTGCVLCAAICPEGAITVYRERRRSQQAATPATA